jgi:hypothetical protein
VKVRDVFLRPAAPSPPGEGGPPSLVCTLPEGGTPDGDRAFLLWIDRYAESANARALDTLQGRGITPKADPIRSWQLMNHLYKFMTGLSFPAGQGPNHSHKVRLLAIQFRLRPEALTREVAAYVARLIEIEEAPE